VTDNHVTLKGPDKSSTEISSESPIGTMHPGKVGMKLQIVVIPVSDIHRVKRFYGDLGWRLDVDCAAQDDCRLTRFAAVGCS